MSLGSSAVLEHHSVDPLQLGVSQSQTVRDYRYGTEAHGCSCDHRIQEQAKHWKEHTRREWHPNSVIDERKKQVLPNIMHRRSAESAGPQNAAKVAG